MTLRTLSALALAATVAVLAAPAQANVVISEVDATGSSNSTYKADWFELTNTGSTAVDMTGWKMDDNSNSFGSAVALKGVTSLAAGQSIVFVEDTGTTDAAVDAAFKSAWFGASTPAGFSIGNYGGSGVGLSASADAVNIFDASGNRVTGVTFNTSTSGVSFDNAAGLSGAISTLSHAGVNGAFLSPTGELGSPGAVSAVPEPASITLLLAGLGLVGLQARRRRDPR